MTGDPVQDALDAFDRAFAAGDADALGALFMPDAWLLLLHTEALEGREAIHAHWRRLFEHWDTSAWRTELLMIDVHGAQAYTVATYSETLVPSDPAQGQRRVVHGRLVRFLRVDADGMWRVSLALNSHSRPVELID